MLIPRFSLRWILVATTAMAILSLVVSLAYQGSDWAMAAVIAVGGLAGLAVTHGLAFVAVWVVSQVFGFGRSQAVPTSPFASSAPPVQILPPQDPVE